MKLEYPVNITILQVQYIIKLPKHLKQAFNRISPVFYLIRSLKILKNVSITNERLAANTKATMYLSNHNATSADFKFHNHCIDHLHDTSVNDYSTSAAIHFDTCEKPKCWDSQSKSTIISGGNTIGFDLGTGAFHTKITSTSNQAVLSAFAAANMVGSDTSFIFYVFSGPGIVSALINSFLNANADALMYALLGQGFKSGKWEAFFVKCSGLDSINCSYAALVPDQADSSVYHFSLILSSDALRLKGVASFASHVGTTFDVSTSRLSIVLDGQVVYSGNKIQSLTLDLLKFSLSDISLSGSIIEVLPVLQAIVAAGTANMRVIEGILNDGFNSDILNAVDKLIKKHLL